MKFFNKFIKSRLTLTTDVGYNNVMNNLKSIFDYGWFDDYEEDENDFNQFIEEFNEWLNLHGVNTSEYKNMKIDVATYLREYAEDSKANHEGLAEFYQDVEKHIQDEINFYEDNDDYWGDTAYELFQSTDYRDLEDDIRDSLSDTEYEDDTDIITDACLENADELEFVKLDDSFDDSNYIQIHTIYLSRDSSSFDLNQPIPYNHDYDFSRTLGVDSAYWLASESGYVDVYPKYDYGVFVSKEKLNRICTPELETLFNSFIVNPDEYYYHSTKQRNLKQFENKTSKDNAYKGEGAMVHGWGLYLQSDKELNINRYKNSLHGERELVESTCYVNEEKIVFMRDDKSWFNETKNEWCDDTLNIYLNTLLSEQGNIDGVISKLSDNIENDKYPKHKMFTDALKFFKQNKIKYVPRHIDQGVSQYTVKIPDGMKFIREETKIPNEVLEKVCENTGLNPDNFLDEFVTDSSELTGKEFYEKLSDLLKSEEKASEALVESGVDGIKYHGGMDGECCVIYNCSKLEIVGED